MLYPSALPVQVKLAGCDAAILRHVQDSITDVQKEGDTSFYTTIYIDPAKNEFPGYNDPDTLYVPIPGWFEMDAWHFTDNAPPDLPHTNAQGPINFPTSEGGTANGTKGAYYFPFDGTDN